MVQEAPDYGPRLTDAEYERRLFELHRSLPPMPTRAQDAEVRRRELEIAIDHRLGRDFPAERRAALWAVQRGIDKKRLRLALRHLVRRLFPRHLVRGAQALAGYAVDEYAKVLSGPELRRFLDLEEGEQPVLPVDTNQVTK